MRRDLVTFLVVKKQSALLPVWFGLAFARQTFSRLANIFSTVKHVLDRQNDDKIYRFPWCAMAAWSS
jgi:hypothetical protein